MAKTPRELSTGFLIEIPLSISLTGRRAARLVSGCHSCRLGNLPDHRNRRAYGQGNPFTR